MRTVHITVAAIALTALACSKSDSHPGTACVSVIADAGGNQSVSKRSTVYLSALASRSTDGAPLQFAWQLTTPAGSAAVLTSTVGPVSSFVADVEGTYVARVLVTGSCTAQATVQLYAVNQTPVAGVSGPAGPVPVRSPVTFTAIASDPDGDPLTYLWTLSKPAGSAAMLDDATAAVVHFTPDVQGTYGVALVASDGAASSTPATASLDARDLPPVAAVPAALYGNVGTLIALDGSASSDPDGDAITFAWTLVASPQGSAAVLADAPAPVAHLTPDVAGAYVVRLTVTDSAASTSKEVAITVWPRVTSLGFRPIDVEYSRGLDRVVAVADAPPSLHLYDAAGAADVSVALNVVPTCVGVSPDGTIAVVGHDGWLSVVDLSSRTLVHTWPLTVPAGDVIVGDPMTVGGQTKRFAYVYPSRDQWSALHAIDLGTGVDTPTSSWAVYAGGRFKQQPGTNHLFLIELGLSPQQLYRYDVTTTGALTSAGGSPYWGDYAMGQELWISGDGVQILMTSGNRFRTSDMTYAGKTAIGAISWGDAPAAPSAAAGKWIVQPAANPWAYPPDTTRDLSFAILDGTYLTTLETVAYPEIGAGAVAYPLHGRYVFFDAAGTKRIALLQVDPAAGYLDDWVIVVL